MARKAKRPAHRDLTALALQRRHGGGVRVMKDRLRLAAWRGSAKLVGAIAL